MRSTLFFCLVFIFSQSLVNAQVIEVHEHVEKSRSEAEIRQLVIIQEAQYKIGNAERVIEKAEVDKNNAAEDVKQAEENIRTGRLTEEQAKTEKETAEATKTKAEADITAAALVIKQALSDIEAAEEVMRKEGININLADESIQKTSASIEALQANRKTAEDSITTAKTSKTQAEKDKTEAEVNKQKTIVINYPNCQTLYITHQDITPCPSGYSQILNSDMVWSSRPNMDDIRLCQKEVPAAAGTECLVGYLVRGIYAYGDDCRIQSTNLAVVPKKMHGRLKFSDFHYGQYLTVTITNKTTGQVLYNPGFFSNGQVVDLPFSNTEDQVFEFYVVDTNVRGIMTVQVDSVNVDNAATAALQQQAINTINKADADIVSADATVKQAEEDKIKIEADIQKLKTDLAGLEQDKKTVLERKTSAEKNRDEAKATKKQKDEDLLTFGVTKESAEKEIGKINTRLEQAELDLAIAESAKTKAEEKKKNAEDRAKIAKDYIAKLNEDMVTAKAALNKL